MFSTLQTTMRSLGNIPYAANQRGSRDLDVGAVLLETLIRLRYSITVTTTAMVGLKWNTIPRLLRTIEFQIQGRDTVINIDGEGAAMHSLLDYGTLGDGMGDTFTLAVGGPYAYDVWLKIPHFLPRSTRPLQTALDLRGIRQASVVVTWGAIADLVTTVNGGAISVTPQLDIFGRYLDFVDPGVGFLVRNLDVQTAPVTGTSASFDITQDKGTGLLYRNFRLVTLRDQVPVTSILDTNTVRVLAGNQQFFTMVAEGLRADAKQFYDLETELTNIYPLMLTAMGDNSQSMPTNALDADLRINTGVTYTSGTEHIKVYREAIRPFLI